MSRVAKIILQWRDSNGGFSLVGYTVKDKDTVAVNVTDTLDNATGLTLNYSVNPNSLNNGGRGITTRHGYSADAINVTAIRTRDPFNIIIDGTLTNEVISKIKVWGASGFSDATTDDLVAEYTLNGTTLQHDARDGGAQPPVEFSINSDTLPQTITVTRASGTVDALTAIVEIELVAPATTDTDTFYGDTLNYTSALTGVTTATLTDSQGNVLNLTDVTDTSATVPALSGGLNGILIENGVTLTLSDGVDSATATLNFIAPTGYELTTLTSVPFEPLETDWVFGFDTPAVIGDQSLKLVSDSFATNNADGTSTFSGSGTYTYFTTQASIGDVSAITKSIDAGGGVVSGVLLISSLISPLTSKVIS